MALEKDLGAVSAYAIAVENGFEGTVEEWLESLKYDHSDEFGVLAGQVQENAETAQSSAESALASASTASGKAGEAAASASASAASASQSASGASAAAASADQAEERALSAGESAQTAQTSASTATSKAGEAAASAEAAAGSAQTAQTSASTATSKAGEAAASAEAAAGSADDIKELIPIPTMDDNGKVMTVVDGKWTAVDPAVSSWEKVQLIVRAGLAPQYFPVGYEFTTHDSTENTDIVWRVVGHNTIKAANESLKHTMILETKYVYSNASGNYIPMQFDATEALYYAETGLVAGTYNFTLPSGYDTSHGGGKTYSFTLTHPVPAGGVIMFPWEYEQQASETKISTYATQTDTLIIEEVGVTEGSEGTNLGTADGTTLNMNYIDRTRNGSNNYAQSADRQWLNSKEAAGSVWKPQTKFDRPPTWANSRAGFMAGLQEDFLAVVQPAIVPCRANSAYEVNSLDGTEFATDQTYNLEDKFFLLSCPEIYGTWDSTEIKDGELLEYYTRLTNVERTKYDPSGLVRLCWLRSPISSTIDHVRSIATSGMLSGYYAVSTVGVAPACIIA